MDNLTPMMKQYMSIKNKYKDSILFFRLGDFYEMFFDDALTASRELEITLTQRDCGMEKKGSNVWSTSSCCRYLRISPC